MYTIYASIGASHFLIVSRLFKNKWLKNSCVGMENLNGSTYLDYHFSDFSSAFSLHLKDSKHIRF